MKECPKDEDVSLHNSNFKLTRSLVFHYHMMAAILNPSDLKEFSFNQRGQSLFK